jgi:hypothetical protein
MYGAGPAGTDVEHAARAKLSDGRGVESVLRGTDDPPTGAVPNG